MYKKFFAFSAALLLAAASYAQGQSKTPVPAKKSALDKATLEAYVRHIFVLDSRITVTVSDPKPSEVPGFVEETVHAALGPQFQDFKFLISKDGSQILQATVYNTANNPFKADYDKAKGEGSPAMGTKGAPVVIVEYSDFECPYCKAEAEMLRKNLLTTYPTQVRLYFKTFPLENLHPWAKAGAMAGKCAQQQSEDAFWEFHDWIFAHQAEVTPENFKDKISGWAKDVKGFDGVKFGQCVDTKATEAEVDAIEKEGGPLEIGGTPTLFINGRRISQTEWPTLKTIIDDEIEYQKKEHNAGDNCGCELQLNVPGVTPSPAPAIGMKKK
jgi:protein-disulfide isomerase